jgi:hypothetical protein
MLGGLSVADENRRSFLKFLGAGIVGLAVGVAGGYALAPERVREIIRTATITQQGGAPSTVYYNEDRDSCNKASQGYDKDRGSRHKEWNVGYIWNIYRAGC